MFDVPSSPVYIEIGGVALAMMPRRFKSGSVGWYLSQKASVGGERVQLSLSAVVIGSKPPSELIDLNGQETAEEMANLLKNASKTAPKAKKGKKPADGPETPEKGN